MKPCIFLDIDGVINPNRKSTTYRFDYSLPNTLAKKLNHPKIANLNIYLVNQVYYCFSKESIDYLKQLIEKYNAQLSSQALGELYTPLISYKLCLIFLA